MDNTFYSDVTVLCDEEADKQLFLRLRTHFPELARIPKDNIKVYPRITESVNERLFRLVNNDRPDFVFLYNQHPLLVLELTEHGYTGDNPLQRFTRLAAAAENRVPAIYFGPFARVRDDELDLVDDPSTLSRRRVNTDLFRGMHCLSKLFKVPMAVAEWVTGQNGKPLKFSAVSNVDTCKRIFAPLVSKILTLVTYSVFKLNNIDSSELLPQLCQIEEELKQTFATSNVRGSQTKLCLSKANVVKFVRNPSSILDVITPAAYFLHDKPERLLSWLCIKHTEIKWIEGKNSIDAVGDTDIFNYLYKYKPTINDDCCFYYTGYKWRSDPHCGVLVNLDYLLARGPGETTPEKRKRALILFYPRVYLNSKSGNVIKLTAEITKASDAGSEFYSMFERRYGSDPAGSISRSFIRRTSGHITQWTESTKQARIFRQYCDFIFLADAVLLGNHLRK